MKYTIHAVINQFYPLGKPQFIAGGFSKPTTEVGEHQHALDFALDKVNEKFISTEDQNHECQPELKLKALSTQV